MAKVKSAPKAAPKKAAGTKAAKSKAAEPAAPDVDVAALQAELTQRRASDDALRAELESVRTQLTDLQVQLQVTQTELKLAQATAKERVDAQWATQTTEQELTGAREAAQKVKAAAERAAEAARAEAMVLRSEIDRLRAQLHGKDNRPPTLQGVGEPTPSKPMDAPAAPVEEREEAAPAKAMPSDDTTKTSGDEKPGFWNRLFKGKKDESTD